MRRMTFTSNIPFPGGPAYDEEDEGLPLPNYDLPITNEAVAEQEAEVERDYGGLPLPDPDRGLQLPNPERRVADTPETPWAEGYPYDAKNGFVTNAFGGPIEPAPNAPPKEHRALLKELRRLCRYV